MVHTVEPLNSRKMFENTVSFTGKLLDVNGGINEVSFKPVVKVAEFGEFR